jgi:hypothetical protein
LLPPPASKLGSEPGRFGSSTLRTNVEAALEVKARAQTEYQPLEGEFVAQIVLEPGYAFIGILQNHDVQAKPGFDKPANEVVTELKADRVG